MSSKDTCATCWYWQRESPQVNLGWCLRYPPPREGSKLSTDHSEWCGEYRSRISMEMQPLHKPKEGEA